MNSASQPAWNAFPTRCPRGSQRLSKMSNALPWLTYEMKLKTRLSLKQSSSRRNFVVAFGPRMSNTFRHLFITMELERLL